MKLNTRCSWEMTKQQLGGNKLKNSIDRYLIMNMRKLRRSIESWKSKRHMPKGKVEKSRLSKKRGILWGLRYLRWSRCLVRSVTTIERVEWSCRTRSRRGMKRSLNWLTEWANTSESWFRESLIQTISPHKHLTEEFSIKKTLNKSRDGWSQSQKILLSKVKI